MKTGRKMFTISVLLLKKFAGFWFKSWVMVLPHIIMKGHGEIPESLFAYRFCRFGQEARVPLGAWFSWTWLGMISHEERGKSASQPSKLPSCGKCAGHARVSPRWFHSGSSPQREHMTRAKGLALNPCRKRLFACSFFSILSSSFWPDCCSFHLFPS